ncbi:acyltransferase [Congregibacter brevis]|uniref:Acyltransferase n=1 Tax=Congregibacter brevis TaxID=3081201 RepID=A0ABZ0IGY7_9GAMM|nr:acyltransferase [Congregibacter sp. IMCC45268]
MLAYWVMVFHLVDIPVIGGYAVYAFFVLSGFLMTAIMQESYGYSARGLSRYALNRFLRLYPAYWFVLCITVILLLLTDQVYIRAYKDVLFLPESVGQFLANASMIYPSYFPAEFEPRLSPPTWALTIELIFYATIGLGASKTIKRTTVWLAASLTYYAATYIFDLNGYHRYGAIPAASLPFALGALAYHFRKEAKSLGRLQNRSTALLLVAAYIANALLFAGIALMFWHPTRPYLLDAGKYLNIILATATVVALYWHAPPDWLKRIDKYLGDLSYPLYLIHWQVGALVSYLLYNAPTRGRSSEGLLSLILATVLALGIALAMSRYLDRNIEKIRVQVRSKSN